LYGDEESDYLGGCIGVAADEIGVTLEDIDAFYEAMYEVETYLFTIEERACLVDLVEENGIDAEQLSNEDLWYEADSISYQEYVDINHQLFEEFADAIEPGLSSELDFGAAGDFYSGYQFITFLEPKGFIPLSDAKLTEFEEIEALPEYSSSYFEDGVCEIDLFVVSIQGTLQQEPDFYNEAVFLTASLEALESEESIG